MRRQGLIVVVSQSSMLCVSTQLYRIKKSKHIIYCGLKSSQIYNEKNNIDILRVFRSDWEPSHVLTWAMQWMGRAHSLDFYCSGPVETDVGLSTVDEATLFRL